MAGGGSLKISLDEMHVVLACRLILQLEGNRLFAPLVVLAHMYVCMDVINLCSYDLS